MTFVVLHPEGVTISEVVEYVEPGTPGAVEIAPEVKARFDQAIMAERELAETLRTGLPVRARGRTS